MGIPDLPLDRRKEVISKRQKMQREALLIELRKNSVMTVACQKAGIPRSTVYRWIKEDLDFFEAVDEASNEGRTIINDMAESVVIKKIRGENLHAAKYWLSHNNERYRTKSIRPVSDYDQRKMDETRDTLKRLIDSMNDE